MRTVVASCYRGRLAGHLRNAAKAIEDGEDYYRFSTITETGLTSDLVFEVDPAMQEDRDTHVVVRCVDDLSGVRSGRPERWVAGESLR